MFNIYLTASSTARPKTDNEAIKIKNPIKKTENPLSWTIFKHGFLNLDITMANRN